MENIIDINESPSNEAIPQEFDEDLQALLYEQVFNLVTNIIIDTNNKKDQLFLMKIIQKIIQNIVEKTMMKEDSEKFRRLKLSNPNVEKFFKVKDSYSFVSYIGFDEKVIDNELYLYLEEDKVSEQLLVMLSYLNLLILNEEDSVNYYNENEKEGLSNIELYNSFKGNELVENGNQPLDIIPYYKKAGIVDILKASKDIRLGKAQSLPENFDKVLHNEQVQKDNSNQENANSSVNQISIINPFYQRKDIKTILKETASVRRENAMKSQYVPNTQFNAPRNNNFNNNQPNNNERPREMTLRDLQYNNPDLSRLSKVKEEIGKRSLELTNEFRVKNNLPRLAWDDEVWKIAYEHSQNMGNRVVPFGHDGFNERIKKFSFYSSLSCENVYMCMGHSQYGLADMAVNGWINSPGHRKNMLTYTTHCAIATYRNGYGEFYLTQIFVKKW